MKRLPKLSRLTTALRAQHNLITFYARSQEGVVHALPLLVVIAAVGIISFLLISSTAPSGGLFGVLNPKPGSNAAGGGFLETFAYGAPTAPQPFNSPRWQLVAGSGNVDGLESTGPSESYETHGFIEASHGPHCEPPINNADPTLNNHIINVPLRDGNGNLIDPATYPTPLGESQGDRVDSDLYQQQVVPNLFYICANHMMDVMKSGYDINTFMPRYLLDWSNGRTQTIQWDTNVFAAARDWFDVYIAPKNEMPMWMVDNKPPVSEGGPLDTEPKDALVLDYNGGAFKFDEWNNYNYSAQPGGAPNYCQIIDPSDSGCSDPRVRRTFKAMFTQNTITLQQQKSDGTFATIYSGNLPVPLNFTTAVVRFEHHTYNATKDFINYNTNVQTVNNVVSPTGNITGSSLAWGQPYSMFTYHWANIIFDGPANPAMQAYIPSPSYVDLNPGNVKTVTVNVTNATISNPTIYALASTTMQDEDVDPYNSQGWFQYRLNGGAWTNFTNVRNGAPFANASGNHNDEIDQATWTGPLAGLHLGTNTIDITFSHVPSTATWQPQNVFVPNVEVQVDPTSDMPPANPGASPLPTAAPTTPPTPTTPPIPTAVPSPTFIPTAPPPTTVPTIVPTVAPTIPPTTPPTAAPTGGVGGPLPTTPPTIPPAPTAGPTSAPVPIVGRVTLTFDNVASQDYVLNGQYPAGQVNWGTNNWFLSSPWQQFTTKSVTFNGPAGVNTAQLNMLVPAHLESLQAYNGGVLPSTVTLTCPGESTTNTTVNPGQAPTTILTGWSGSCTNPTLSSSNGWDTNFDNLVLADPNTNPIVTPAPTAIPTAAPTAVPTVAPTSTPRPTATPPQSTTPPATPTPVPTAVAGATTITFDDLTFQNRVLTGQYPTGVINWGTGNWFLSAPWGSFKTKSISFNDASKTKVTFAFITPKILVSLDAYNGGNTSSTVTIACTNNVTKSVTLAAAPVPGQGPIVNIATGWTTPCTTVTIASSNGWWTNFDNLSIK